jgi:hypothetical protein
VASQRSAAFFVSHRWGKSRLICFAANGSASQPLSSHSASAFAQPAVPNELLPCQQLIHGDVQGDAAEAVDRLPLFVAPSLAINLPYAQATKEVAGIWGG